jgi:NADH-ubiquinone oxidoreductase chain 2
MLTISILSILLSNAVNIRRDISILYSRIGILSLSYCLLNDITSLIVTTKGISLHGGLLLVTNVTQIFHIFLFIVTILILTLTSFFPRKILNKSIRISQSFISDIINKTGEHLRIAEYPLIILFVVTGAILLISTNDLVSIFLAIELQSYGLYIISTIYRDSELSTTGGIMYFLLGGLSSCFILLGTSLIYANSGSTNLDNLYIITNISDISSMDL